MRLGLLLVALLLIGAQAPVQSPVVAEAGDVKMTEADVAALLAASNADLRAKLASDPALLDRVIRAQVVQMLVLREAHDKQWDTKPNIEFLARQAHDSAIASSYLASLATPPADYPSDAEIQATYDAQKDRLMLPRQFHVAQIFVAVPANAAPAVEADARRRITMLRQAVGKPHADFAAVAKKESDDKNSAPSGGELGWMAADRIRPRCATRWSACRPARSVTRCAPMTAGISSRCWG
jgi:peptidylprolyl isomerase